MISNSETFELQKQININPTKKHIMGSMIQEFDIESAHAAALYFIKGETLYNELKSMEKLPRNIRIGNMIKNDRTLSDKINELILKWTNQFIRANNIKANQFLESTRDSIMIWNKIPKNTIFENGIVNFRNKEGEYTSYHRLHNRYTILYDSGGGISEKRIRIKGINDDYTQSSKFVKNHLMKVLYALELSIVQGKNAAVKKLKLERTNIIKAKNGKDEDTLCIFRELSNKNLYSYLNQTDKKVETIQSDILLGDNELILDTSKNYVEFIIPLIKTIFI